MELNKETIHITDDIFLRLRADMDKAMQYLLSNMIHKESSDGKISVNISVGLVPEYVANANHNYGEPESRLVYHPRFEHEIKTKMQFEEKEKGMNYLGEHELYYDEGKKEYMVKLVTNTEQMSMFDDEFNRGGSRRWALRFTQKTSSTRSQKRITAA